jgi:DNA-binding MarR family transcriptional regulator
MQGARRSLQEELKQTKPFESPAHEATLALWRTADHVRRVLAQAVEARGITLQQYNVLRILRGAGPRGLPTLDIASRMIEQTPGITRLLDRLERKQLIERRRCPDDRRQVLCTICDPGLSLLEQLDGAVRKAYEGAMSPLEPGEIPKLIELLERIRSRPVDGGAAFATKSGALEAEA